MQVRTIGPARGGVIVLAVSGDLDNDTEHLLAHGAGEALDAGCRRLILQCAGVTFCDSRGLNRLLQLRQDAQRRGVDLVLAAISTPVRHVLELTEALQVFVLADTVQQAVCPPSAADTDADTPGRGIPTL
ncbi:STAS domain-containing protein [Streptomyces sp. NPDC006733]|uniref:STAS domain-containing protein n=1 Tax=Streptomyces sp. NPDC006733 TaxID=3155460 RepID=UPI0033C85A3E